MKLLLWQRMIVIAGLSLTPFLAACSSSNIIVNQWRNPAYVGPGFRSVMVGGLIEQTSVRRNFEDEFLAQLRSAGVQAAAGYQYIPEEVKYEEAKLKQAAREARVDALIVARPVKVEQKTDYGPSYYPVPSFGIFGSNVGAVWHGGYGGGGVRRYTEYTSEATLYDVAKDEVVWSGSLKTSEPPNMDAAVKLYVQSVMNALREKKLLGARQ
jgi:hypothetical protein